MLDLREHTLVMNDGQGFIPDKWNVKL